MLILNSYVIITNALTILRGTETDHCYRNGGFCLRALLLGWSTRSLRKPEAKLEAVFLSFIFLFYLKDFHAIENKGDKQGQCPLSARSVPT
jgi:hypothetical protein